MPSGRQHDRITLVSLPVVIAVSFWITKRWDLVIITSLSFVFSGLMFGPDLDIRSLQYKRWGILQGFWDPYQRAMRHRSLLSHGFLIGTLVRLWYLLSFLLFWLILIRLGYALINKTNWDFSKFVQQTLNLIFKEHPQEIISSLVGLEVGAMSHSLSDWLGSAYKRLNKPKRKKRPRQ